MSGGEVSDGWQWWAVEGEFELGEFDKYEFGRRFDGPTVAVVDGLSFAFRVWLHPNGVKCLGAEEVRDHMGVGIALVDGPKEEVDEFKFNVKVYKADGSLENRPNSRQSLKLARNGRCDSKALPMAADKLAPYVLGEEGSQFVKVRVEFGIPLTTLDALALLPAPALRQDLPERFGRWCHSDNGTVTVAAGDGGRPFTVYKDLLTEASDVFKGMLDTAMKEGGSGRIEIKDLCTDALDELISFITSGATRPSRLRAHVIKLLDVAQGYFFPDLKRLCERAVVEKMQEKKLTDDFLDLLQAAQTYELRVAMNVGLCRLLKDYPQHGLARFDSAKFAVIRTKYMKLASQAHRAIKC